jgi:hypothetical protein
MADNLGYYTKSDPDFRVQYRDNTVAETNVQHRGWSRLSGTAPRVNETFENISRAIELRLSGTLFQSHFLLRIYNF